MKNIFAILLLFFSHFIFSQEKQTIITNVNIFDGENIIENTSIVFKDGKILSITEAPESLAGSILIDGKNKTIIPPLVNAHVHVWLAANLKEALKIGVYGLLDMHSTDEWANSLRIYNDSLNYSKYYSSNAGATVPGGHGTQYGIAVPTINDSLSPSQFVKDRIGANADYIKILKEPLRPTLNSVQTLEIINEAHKHNKLAVAHVTKLENAVELTGQNVDGFVHIWVDKSASEENLDLMRSKNIFIVPTLSVIEKLLKNDKAKDWFNEIMIFEKVLEEIGRAYKKGIPILAGTDAPNFGMNYTTQLFDEMILLSKAGLTNEDVLKSATVNIYNAFDLKDFSKIQTGNEADFILIDGNPVKNIEEIKNSKKIFKKGIEVNTP